MPKFIEGWEDDEKKRSETVNWLLSNSNTIYWTNYPNNLLQEMRIIGWESNPEYLYLMQQFKHSFLERRVDNIEYGDVSHPSKKIFTHNYFKIEGKVKQYIIDNGPIPTGNGFWDPVYLLDDQIIASTVGHENLLISHEVVF